MNPPGDAVNEDQGHYWKYRVFKEPVDQDVQDIDSIGHPVPVDAQYLSAENEGGFELWNTLEEIEGDFFLLRPESDHHARVAIAAYAYSCRIEQPELAADLILMVESLEWEEQTGQNRGDFPITAESMVGDIEEVVENHLKTHLRIIK